MTDQLDIPLDYFSYCMYSLNSIIENARDRGPVIGRIQNQPTGTTEDYGKISGRGSSTFWPRRLASQFRQRRLRSPLFLPHRRHCRCCSNGLSPAEAGNCTYLSHIPLLVDSRGPHHLDWISLTAPEAI